MPLLKSGLPESRLPVAALRELRTSPVLACNESSQFATSSDSTPTMKFFVSAVLHEQGARVRLRLSQQSLPCRGALFAVWAAAGGSGLLHGCDLHRKPILRQLDSLFARRRVIARDHGAAIGSELQHAQPTVSAAGLRLKVDQHTVDFVAKYDP
jgi:hypothetical protein